MARLCVHEDEQRVRLLGAAADDVLQGGDVFEGVERHHPVVVVPRQQEHGGVLDPVAFWDADVMERGVSGKEVQGSDISTSVVQYINNLLGLQI